MTERLATALRETADATLAYDVLDAAITLGRRQRMRARLGSAAAMLAVLALAFAIAVPVLVPANRHSASTVDMAALPAALPDEISVPAANLDRVQQKPPGAAAVIFMESQYAATSGPVITVGARDDTYRSIGLSSGEPGQTVLLSPAGDLIAYSIGSMIEVSNLDTGASRRYETGAEVTPAAWLPDGSGLIVVTIRYPRDATDDFSRSLYEMDIQSGGTHQFAEATWPIAPAGFAVAVSPDATRIAYQFSDFITVYDRVRGSKTTFTLPERAMLAGKAAWTPDGQSIAIIQRDTRTLVSWRWQVLVLDPATGVERNPAQRSTMDNISLVRLVGWNRSTGSPVVVGYLGPTAAEGTEFQYGQNSVAAGDVQHVGVYELGAAGVRTLMRPAEGVGALDVADTIAASGLVRTATPPSDNDWGVAVVLAGTAVLLALLMLGLMYRLRTRPHFVH